MTALVSPLIHVPVVPRTTTPYGKRCRTISFDAQATSSGGASAKRACLATGDENLVPKRIAFLPDIRDDDDDADAAAPAHHAREEGATCPDSPPRRQILKSHGRAAPRAPRCRQRGRGRLADVDEATLDRLRALTALNLAQMCAYAPPARPHGDQLSDLRARIRAPRGLDARADDA